MLLCDYRVSFSAFGINLVIDFELIGAWFRQSLWVWGFVGTGA